MKAQYCYCHRGTARIIEVIACTPPDSGALYCIVHCPAGGGDACSDAEHGVDFGGTEIDQAPPSCDMCNATIEGYVIIR